MNRHQPSRFWDRIADRYARRPVANEAVYQEKLRITRELLTADSEVLEIGCGTGSTAIALAPFARHIRALDFSARMIGIASDKAAAGNIDNVTFEQRAVEDLAQPKASVDVALAHSILHLVDDRRAALADLYQVLKPGGVLVSSTACIGDMLVLLRLLIPVMRLVGLAPPVSIFTGKELLRDFGDAGFAVERQWQPGKNQALFVVARKPR